MIHSITSLRAVLTTVVVALIVASTTPVPAVAAPKSTGSGDAGQTDVTADSFDEKKDVRIAVLPLLNRSGGPAPLRQIRQELILQLESYRGIYLLDDDVLDDFMRRHRMRYTGGLNRQLSRAIKEETESAAVLITSLDLYQEKNPPKMGLTARLVATGEEPRILWMDSTSRTGDQAPGVADTGLIRDIEEILEIATSNLAKLVPREATTIPAAEGEIPTPKRNVRWRFRPKIFYHSPDFPIVSERAGRVVVLPFANDSTVSYAGEIMRDQLILHLVEADVNVIEPGVVRQAMLEARQIYEEGPSVPEMDILKVTLRADVVLFGEVDRFTETGPATPRPAVDFTFKAINTQNQQIIWTSVSHSQGSDGVAFFDVGKVPTAQKLASKMAEALVATVRLEGPRPEKKRKRR